MQEPHFLEARQLVAAAAETEPGIAELQAAMAAGRLTARTLVERYLSRIEALDRRGPALHSIIEINPDALALAAALDAERQATGPRELLPGLRLRHRRPEAHRGAHQPRRRHPDLAQPGPRWPDGSLGGGRRAPPRRAHRRRSARSGHAGQRRADVLGLLSLSGSG